VPSVVNYPTAGKAPAWRIEIAGGRPVQVIDATGEVKAAVRERPAPRGRADPDLEADAPGPRRNDMGLVWRW
jgi:hypothetical protein